MDLNARMLEIGRRLEELLTRVVALAAKMNDLDKAIREAGGQR